MTTLEKYLLLGCLTRQEELIKTAIVKVNGYQLFDNYTDPECAFIWSVLSDCYKACKGMPTQGMMRQEISSRLKFLRTLDPVTLMAVFDMIMGLPNDELTMPVGNLYLDTALGEMMKIEWTKRLSKTGGVDDMKDFAGLVHKDAVTMGTGVGTIDNYPLYSPQKYIKHVTRTPLGLHFWDEIAGGGIAEGEVFGLLGPTGGGKTVLAISIFIARAMRNQFVNLYQYEQTLEGDIMERICTKMTNFPIGTFRNKGWDDVDPHARLKYCEVAATWGRFANVTSFANPGMGAGGAQEIITHCDQCIKRGEKPSLIIVDWLGAMVERYLAANNLNEGNSYRTVAARFVDELKIYCDTMKISAIIIHQLRTDAARNSPKYEPNVTDAHEFRSFSNKMDACYCLGNLDPKTLVAWFLADKNRRGPRGKALIKLDGENQTFTDASGDYVISHRGEFTSSKGDRVPDVDTLMGNDLSKIDK